MVWEKVVGVLAAGLGVLAWALSAGLPKAEGPGPELFPRVLGTALVLGGLYLLWEKAEGPRIRLGRAWLPVLLLTLFFSPGAHLGVPHGRCPSHGHRCRGRNPFCG